MYSDSLIGLNWISHYANLEKMNKKTVFIQNKLKKLDQLCEIHPVTFSFVEGYSNPADAVTRAMSYRQLSKTNYLSGPSFLISSDEQISRADILTVTLPSIHSSKTTVNISKLEQVVSPEHLLDHNKISS